MTSSSSFAGCASSPKASIVDRTLARWGSGSRVRFNRRNLGLSFSESKAESFSEEESDGVVEACRLTDERNERMGFGWEAENDRI